MKTLLTGANGFVGSHILRKLLAQGVDTSILIRETSDTSLIDDIINNARVLIGSLDDLDSLENAVRNAECIIHCAGKTKAARPKELYSANREGTARLLDAVSAKSRRLKHFILISSLAVSGPGTVESPAREDARPLPKSHYGKSKRMAENQVIRRCPAPWTILRPGPVYGAGDKDFLLTFKPLTRRIMPLIDGGRMRISLIYAPDAARGVLECIGRGETFGKTYHLGSHESITTARLLRTASKILGVKPRELRIPSAMLYPFCMITDALARRTGKVMALNMDKLHELRSPGWVCSVDRLASDIGFTADTPLADGLAETFAWYRDRGWL